MTREDLPVLPSVPGCYFYKDRNGTVIYVGKAVNLRSRVGTYFNGKANRKVHAIISEAASLDFVVAQNEVDALLLEANLIKSYKPRYNVMLKDDKTYPFLKLTNEEFPMLQFTRRIVKDGGTYFGPYPNAGAVRRVQELIASIFPLRQNSGSPMQHRKKACLRFHMGRCLAPCIRETDPDTYSNVVDQVRTFLEGRVEATEAGLVREMTTAAERQDFELAATFRDRIDALRKLTGFDSPVVSTSGDNLDFLGLAVGGNFAMVQVFQMRQGRVIGRDKRFLTNAVDAQPGEILDRFLAEYYTHAPHVPPLILVPNCDLELFTWTTFLSGRAGRKVSLRTPKRGDKVELMEMATRNARTGLEAELALLQRRGEAPGVQELQQLTRLETPPWRIEGFDISNLMGTHTVAGIAVFEGGRSRKSEYRRLRITGLDKPDDFASMYQAVYRRFTGSLADKMVIPDLLLIDGGKGQLTAARRALDEARLEIPLLGLAKRHETIVTEDKGEILVPETHPGLRMLIHIRDETHRIAVGYNRKLRGRASTRSILDDVPGIGPKRRDALLNYVSSIDELKEATVAELSRVPGVGRVAAKSIKTFFSRKIVDSGPVGDCDG
jgi:excinuclease ABC subunit C